MPKKVEKFEELIAWQKARKLTGRIYKATTQGNFARDYSLKDQIRRAAVSTMSNIAEGLKEGVQRNFIGFWSLRRDLVQSCEINSILHRMLATSRRISSTR